MATLMRRSDGPLVMAGTGSDRPLLYFAPFFGCPFVAAFFELLLKPVLGP